MGHRLIQNNELVLYGPVGFRGLFDVDDGFTASEVLAALAEMSGDIAVRLNSGGGLAFDGIAIFNALLVRDSRVTVVVDAIAASAASIIAVAGDKVVMRSGSMLMIHNASGVTTGTAEEHAKQAGVLSKLDGEIARIYAHKTGKDIAFIKTMMDQETWLDADEAVALGFASVSESEGGPAPTAFDYRVYARTPANLNAYSRAARGTAVLNVQKPMPSFAPGYGLAARLGPPSQTMEVTVPRTPFEQLIHTEFTRVDRGGLSTKGDGDARAALASLVGYALRDKALTDGVGDREMRELARQRLATHDNKEILAAAAAYFAETPALRAEFPDGDSYGGYIVGITRGSIRQVSAGLISTASRHNGLPSLAAGEAAWSAAWDADPAIRTEFRYGRESFMAFMRGETRQAQRRGR